MEVVTVLASVVLGVALAASCGLRAFLPLFMLGVAARLGFVDVGEHFAWIAGAPALLALGVGVAFELLADKVPLIHHLLDVLATPVRTVAGMLVFAAAVVEMPVWVVALLAIIVGGGVALAVHVARTGVRAASSAATAGTSAPAHSLAEDGVCAGAAALSMVFWTVALLVAAAALLLFVVSARTLLHRLRR